MSNIMKGMVTDESNNNPNVIVPGFGTVGIEQLKKHVQALSAEFDSWIQAGQFTKAAYYSEQFFNSLLALAKALKQMDQQNTIGEDQAPMFTPEGYDIEESQEETDIKKKALKVMYDTVMTPLRGTQLYPTTEDDFLKIAAVSLQDLFSKRYNNLTRQQLIPASQKMAKDMLVFFDREPHIRAYKQVSGDKFVRESSIMKGLKQDA